MEHEITVIEDPQEIGRCLEVFLTAMVGLPRPDPARIHEFAEPGRTIGAYVPAEVVPSGAASSSSAPASLGAGPAEQRLVGTASSFTSWMIVPGGKKVAQGAITDVGVLATHTRRGLAGALVRAQLELSRERGEVIASLRASEATIYERWGFGIATEAASVEIEVAQAATRPGVPGGGEVRVVDLGDRADLDTLERIYAAVDWVAAIDRPSYWWRSREHMRSHLGGQHYAVVHGKPGAEDGFVIYSPQDAAGWFRSRDRAVVVGDFVATTPAARIGLLRHLLSVDLLHRVVIDSLPVDHSLGKLFVDERAVRTLAIQDETWLRLVDVRGALAARGFRSGGQVVLEVRDDVLPANRGRYLVSAAGVARTDQEPDIALDVAQLACVYLGGTSWRQLAEAGRIEVRGSGQVDVADHLFGVARAPFGGTLF